MSLFERLVRKGYPLQTLEHQYRIRPEIANLVRTLTYPKLVNSEETKSRPDLRGIRGNVVFITHAHLEDETPGVADLSEIGSKSSKQNSHEVQMVLKILRYLAQQGYGSEKMMILTPCSGQLHKLQKALRDDGDPILSDPDSFSLVRAGLTPVATAQLMRKQVRLATIGMKYLVLSHYVR